MTKSNTLDVEKIVESILKLVPHVKVSPHGPGKIKLQVGLSGLALLQDANLLRALESIPGILRTRTSFLSRSAVVEYDQDLLPYDLWESIFHLKEKPEQAPQFTARLKRHLNNLSP